LEHGSYRVLKKAPLNLLESLGLSEKDTNYQQEFVEAVVFSDGNHGLIVPAKYIDRG